MRKHRSIKFMAAVTLLTVLLCGFVGWVACRVEPVEYDQREINGACRYQANKYLSEVER